MNNSTAKKTGDASMKQVAEHVVTIRKRYGSWPGPGTSRMRIRLGVAGPTVRSGFLG